MKLAGCTYRFILIVVLAVFITGCEGFFDDVFEKEAKYKYIIKNNSSATIKVTIRPITNPTTIVKGDPSYGFEVGSGSEVIVYNSTGVSGEQVWDMEKDNTSLYWFEITEARMGGMGANLNLNDPQQWEYHEENNYQAFYTLTLSDEDFL